MTDTKALIITGGEVDTEFLCKKEEYALVIAVDGGLERAVEMKLAVDVILGDFDTVSEEVLEKYQAKEDVEVVRLNPEKDNTDTHEAILYAMKQGMDRIDMLGAIGDRLDHSLGNLFSMKMALEQGVEVIAYTKRSKIYLIQGMKTYQKQELFGKYISFLQFDGSAYGVTLTGFYYPLNQFDFDTAKTYRLGISNEMKEDTAKITIERGCILAIESKEDKNPEKKELE